MADERVCSLDFRPRRLFCCRLETVLQEFFSTEDQRLAMMPAGARDLSLGLVRVGLDERVVVDAAFSPALGRGITSVRLFYRLPTTEPKRLHRLLALLERSSCVTGYHRFGQGTAAALRGSERIRTTVVRQLNGESYLLTRVWFRLRVKEPSALILSASSSAGVPPSSAR